jgi:DNA-binding IclR family transcriptional regulator
MTAVLTSELSECRTSRAGVVERLTQILDVFAHGPDELSLDDLALLSGLPKSTTFRLLRQLVEMHWPEHDNRGYRLGPRMQRLAHRVTDYSGLRAAAADTLNRLHLASSAVVHLVVLEGSHVHYLDKVGGAASLSVPSRVGVRVPAHLAVSGLSLLSSHRPEQVDELFNAADVSSERLTRLHEQLTLVRQRHGLAVTPGDMSTAIRAAAAPVTGPHGPVAAISAAVRGAGTPVEALMPMVAHAARRITHHLQPH